MAICNGVGGWVDGEGRDRDKMIGALGSRGVEVELEAGRKAEWIVMEEDIGMTVDLKMTLEDMGGVVLML